MQALTFNEIKTYQQNLFNLLHEEWGEFTIYQRVLIQMELLKLERIITYINNIYSHWPNEWYRNKAAITGEKIKETFKEQYLY